MTADGIPRRVTRLQIAVGIALMIAIAVGVLLSPLPAFVFGPGPVISVTEGLLVDGQPARELVDGDFLFTTIAGRSARGRDAIAAAFDPEVQVLSRSELIPVGMSDAEFGADQAAKFDDSVRAAAEAAGTVLEGAVPEVEFDGGVVGGPSAGLLISLAIHDAASPLDVAAGRQISGTGEIEPDGSVTSVGAIAFKVIGAAEAGAEVFLVPSSQVAQAEAAVPEGAVMDVLAVDTIAEAVTALTGGR